MGDDDTKTRILHSTYEVMLNQGYAAAGVGEICRHAGVSKGSFYHFFETKQQCALEMLRHHMAEAEALIESGINLEGVDGIEAGFRYVRHIEDLSRRLFQHGCLVGAFALELAETDPEMQREVSQIFKGTTDRFEEVLAPLARACRQPGSPSARDLAEQLLTAIEGGVVLSKAHGDLRFVSQAIRLFRHYLETLCHGVAAEPN